MGWNLKSEQRGDVDFSFETFLKKFNEKILNTTCDAPCTRIIQEANKTLKKSLDKHWNIRFY